MAFESTRATRMAIKEESTEGTPVVPASGADFIAVQEGFALNNDVSTVTNAELQGTIGKSADIPGLEAPTASFSHYLRHSGTEGQAPGYYLLMKSLFGSYAANSSERSTTTSSTVSTVKLAAGGSDFSRGSCILLKDSTNVYSIRNVTSVATNDLSLAFNLAVAPGSGVACGKNLKFYMSDTGTSNTLWCYDGNGGAIRMIAGAKTTSASISIPAGDAINVDYSLLGSQYYFNPITINATNHHIDFDEGGSELNAILTQKTYRDPDELRAEIEEKMDALATADITVTYSNSTGKFTIASGGVTFAIRWATGTNTATSASSVLGFSNADDTGSTSYTSDQALSWASPYTPTLDSASLLIAKANELMIGSATDYACISASEVSVEFNKDAVDVMDVCATTGKSSTLFNGRTIDINVTAYMQKHDISKWLAYKNNTTVQFAYTAGEKSGGNWVAGKCINMFSPTAKILGMEFEDQDGIIVMNLTLQCFVSSALDEFYLNLL